MVARDADAAPPVVWEDMCTGKCHFVNNATGERIACDRSGKPLPRFLHGVSGVATTKVRLARAAEVQKAADARVRAATVAPVRSSAKQTAAPSPDQTERVVTKGRFGTKLPKEYELNLREQQIRNSRFPELVALREEEEAIAREKIAELHTNYIALAASSNVNAGKKTAEGGSTKRHSLSRSEQWAFTNTGVYRP